MINLNNILKTEPTLTAMGIEGPNTFHTNEMPDINQVQTCIDWLATAKRSQRINKTITSYGFKHKAERAYKTYVTNGAFIAAVIYLGIPYKKIPDSPNIYVALSPVQ